MGRRVRFSKEFKLEAVRLLDLGKKSAAELALELGVRRNQLYKWKKQLNGKGESDFRGPGRKPAVRPVRAPGDPSARTDTIGGTILISPERNPAKWPPVRR